MAILLERSIASQPQRDPFDELRRMNTVIEDRKNPEPIPKQVIDRVVSKIESFAEKLAVPDHYRSFHFPRIFFEPNEIIQFARYWRQKLREVRANLQQGFEGVALEDRAMYLLNENYYLTGQTHLLRSHGFLAEIVVFKKEWPDIVSYNLFEHAPPETKAIRELFIYFKEGKISGGAIFVRNPA